MRFSGKSCYLILLTFLTWLPVAAQSETVDQVAASVDGELITFSDLRWLVQYRNLQVPQDPEERDDFYQTLLDQLIDQRIIALEASQTPVIDVTEDEVQAQINAYKSRFPNEAGFEQKLREMNMSREEFRDLIRRQLAVNEFVEARFKPFIIVLPSEIEQYYDDRLLPELQRSKEPAPPLETVEESIRQILTEEKTNQELDRWLRSARRRSTVVNLLFRDQPYAPNLPPELLTGRDLKTISVLPAPK